MAVFEPTAHRSYKGHQQDVLDVAWSKSFFLLTASMDKSVRLWHVSMDDCLRVFRQAPSHSVLNQGTPGSSMCLPAYGSILLNLWRDCLLRQAGFDAAMLLEGAEVMLFLKCQSCLQRCPC